MSIKHYDVARAASPSDLAEKLTHKMKEGWQPFGRPVANVTRAVKDMAVRQLIAIAQVITNEFHEPSFLVCRKCSQTPSR